MNTISRGQVAALGQQRRQQFRHQMLAHLRANHEAWCAGRDDTALLRHVDASIAFSEGCNVRQPDNLLRMASLQLHPRFSARPGGYAWFRLTQPGFDETTRVRHYAAALDATHAPVLVSLATDLAALERGHV